MGLSLLLVPQAAEALSPSPSCSRRALFGKEGFAERRGRGSKQVAARLGGPAEEGRLAAAAAPSDHGRAIQRREGLEIAVLDRGELE